MKELWNEEVTDLSDLELPEIDIMFILGIRIKRAGFHSYQIMVSVL